MAGVSAKTCGYEHAVIEYVDSQDKVTLTEKNWNHIVKAAESDNGIFLLTFFNEQTVRSSTHFMRVTKVNKLISVSSFFFNFIDSTSHIIKTYEVSQLEPDTHCYQIQNSICAGNNEPYIFIDVSGQQYDALAKSPKKRTSTGFPAWLKFSENHELEMSASSCTDGHKFELKDVYEEQKRVDVFEASVSRVNSALSEDTPNAAGSDITRVAQFTSVTGMNKICDPCQKLNDSLTGIVKKFELAIQLVALVHNGAENNHSSWIDVSFKAMLEYPVEKLLFLENKFRHKAIDIAIRYQRYNIFTDLYSKMVNNSDYTEMDAKDKTKFIHKLLWVSINNRNYDALEFLGKQEEVNTYKNTPTGINSYPLYGLAAIKKNPLQMIEKLHSLKIDVNLRDSKLKLSGLMYATCMGAPLAAVKRLVRIGADIHAKDKYGNTALHYAVAKQDVALITYFMNSDGIDLEVENNNKQTPFQVSVAIVQEVTETANIDKVVDNSKFVSDLIKKKKTKALAQTLITQQFQVVNHEDYTNIKKFVDDIFYHSFINDDLKQFKILLGEVLNIEGLKLRQTTSQESLQKTDLNSLHTNNDITMFLFAYCCMDACGTSAKKIITFLKSAEGTKALFSGPGSFCLNQADLSKQGNYFPLMSMAAISKKPIDTLNYLEKLQTNPHQKYSGQNVLMVIFSQFPSSIIRVEGVRWLINKYPDLLKEKDAEGNNFIYYLLKNHSDCATELFAPILLLPECLCLLYEKNNQGEAPVQVGSCQLPQVVKLYVDQEEFYLARQAVIQGRDLMSQEVTEVEQTMLEYSRFVEEIVPVAETLEQQCASASSEAKTENAVDKSKALVQGLKQNGWNMYQIQSFCGHMHKEKQPSEIYELLNSGDSLLKEYIEELATFVVTDLTDLTDAIEDTDVIEDTEGVAMTSLTSTADNIDTVDDSSLLTADDPQQAEVTGKHDSPSKTPNEQELSSEIDLIGRSTYMPIPRIERTEGPTADESMYVSAANMLNKNNKLDAYISTSEVKTNEASQAELKKTKSKKEKPLPPAKKEKPLPPATKEYVNSSEEDL